MTEALFRPRTEPANDLPFVGTQGAPTCCQLLPPPAARIRQQEATMRIIMPAALGWAVGSAVGNALADRGARRRHIRDFGRTVTLAGERVRLLDEGEGPPVLVVHGNGATIEEMVLSGVIGRLSRSCRVVLPERPGYGAGDVPNGRPWPAHRHADALAELIQARGLRQPVVLGHSLGALVALRLALDHPHLVAGLVLVSGYYVPRPQFSITAQKPLSWPVLGPASVATLVPPIASAVMPLIFRRLFAPNPVPPAMEEMPVELMLRRAHLQSTADGTALIERDAAAASSRFSELRVPLRLFAGEGDRIIPAVHHARALVEACPQAQFTALSATGHMAHHVHPDLVADAVLDLAKA